MHLYQFVFTHLIQLVIPLIGSTVPPAIPPELAQDTRASAIAGQASLESGLKPVVLSDGWDIWHPQGNDSGAVAFSGGNFDSVTLVTSDGVRKVASTGDPETRARKRRNERTADGGWAFEART